MIIDDRLLGYHWGFHEELMNLSILTVSSYWERCESILSKYYDLASETNDKGVHVPTPYGTLLLDAPLHPSP